MDTLIEQGNTGTDSGARQKAYCDAAKTVWNEAPWIFLVFQNQARGTLKPVEGLPILPDTMIRPKTVWLNR